MQLKILKYYCDDNQLSGRLVTLNSELTQCCANCTSYLLRKLPESPWPGPRSEAQQLHSVLCTPIIISTNNKDIVCNDKSVM